MGGPGAAGSCGQALLGQEGLSPPRGCPWPHSLACLLLQRQALAGGTHGLSVGPPKPTVPGEAIRHQATDCSELMHLPHQIPPQLQPPQILALSQGIFAPPEVSITPPGVPARQEVPTASPRASVPTTWYLLSVRISVPPPTAFAQGSSMPPPPGAAAPLDPPPSLTMLYHAVTSSRSSRSRCARLRSQSLWGGQGGLSQSWGPPDTPPQPPLTSRCRIRASFSCSWFRRARRAGAAAGPGGFGSSTRNTWRG